MDTSQRGPENHCVSVEKQLEVGATDHRPSPPPWWGPFGTWTLWVLAGGRGYILRMGEVKGVGLVGRSRLVHPAGCGPDSRVWAGLTGK